MAARTVFGLFLTMVMASVLACESPTQNVTGSGPELARPSSSGVAQRKLRGLSVRETVVSSASARRAMGDYNVVRPGKTSPGVFRAKSDGQGFSIRFVDSAVTIASTSTATSPTTWDLKLQLSRWGRGGTLGKAPPIAETTATGNRLKWQRVHGSQRLTEWYVNRPEGLEQGFDIAKRSATPTARGEVGELVFEFVLSGSLTSTLRLTGAGEQEIIFRDALERPVARYRKLRVTDALGRSVPAKLALIEKRLQIRVDDSKAKYPLTVDPVVSTETVCIQPAKAEFGDVVAMSGNTAVVQARQLKAVYVYVRSGTAWALQATLAPADAGWTFGESLAIQGDTIVVGDSRNRKSPIFNGGYLGAAYVFVRAQSRWTLQQKLPSARWKDDFGASVGVSADSLIIGAPADPAKGTAAGSAAVYTRASGTWTFRKKLLASDGAPSDAFGTAVAVDGDAWSFYYNPSIDACWRIVTANGRYAAIACVGSGQCRDGGNAGAGGDGLAGTPAEFEAMTGPLHPAGRAPGGRRARRRRRPGTDPDR